MSCQGTKIPLGLSQVLDDHKRWLETGRKAGEQPDLAKYDFQGLDLSQAVLERAQLEGANFQGACLARANLRQAKLAGATFAGALVSDADFRDADLEKADLAESTGLTEISLARANLKDCKLPEELRKFSRLEHVKEASGITSSLLTTMLAACGLAAFTALTITDAALLTNTGTTSLPFLNIVTNISFFYWLGPILLLAMYIYFHLNLQHLWEVIGTLPAVFPDGQQLNQKVYPWLFNWLPSGYFVQSEKGEAGRPAYWFLEKSLAVLIAWFFVPFTLMVLWFRYLYVRDAWLTYWHVALLTAAFWSGCHFYSSCKAAILGEDGGKRRRFNLTSLATGIFLVLIYGFSDGIINGIPAKLEEEVRPEVGGYFHRELVPEMLDYLPWKATIAANFEEAEISTYKEEAKEQDEDRKVISKGANLRGRDLRYCQAKGALMAKADLRGANLEGAYCRGADLRKAKLGETGYPEEAAKLPKANLFRANLTAACLFRADLFKASLEGATLIEANLEEAVLAEANLSSAVLTKAQLGGAILRAANLQGANLTGAKGLEVSQLKEARGWMLALYDPDIIEKLGLEKTHYDKLEKAKQLPRELANLDLGGTNLERFDFREASLEKSSLSKANLREANFSKASLQGANLKKANLMGAKFPEADLKGVDLTGANLWQADFRGAKGLAEKQIMSGKNWRLAFYDEEVIRKLNLEADHNSRVATNQYMGKNLQGVDLNRVNLVGVNFQGADLRGADLSFTELRQANLEGANLSGAKLTGAFLGQARLRAANMDGADLTKADLKGVDLTKVQGLSSSQLKSAVSDSRTKFPD